MNAGRDVESVTNCGIGGYKSKKSTDSHELIFVGHISKMYLLPKETRVHGHFNGRN